MNLIKATGTIGGLTMVSRVLGFAREMVFARIMGAGREADAFALAFLIPNLFRRLFGEGAFAAGFVPLFSRRLQRASCTRSKPARGGPFWRAAPSPTPAGGPHTRRR